MALFLKQPKFTKGNWNSATAQNFDILNKRIIIKSLIYSLMEIDRKKVAPKTSLLDVISFLSGRQTMIHGTQIRKIEALAQFDCAELIEFWKNFYKIHDLPELAVALPEEIFLDSMMKNQLEVLMRRDNLDSLILCPPVKLQRKHLKKILSRMTAQGADMSPRACVLEYNPKKLLHHRFPNTAYVKAFGTGSQMTDKFNGRSVKSNWKGNVVGDTLMESLFQRQFYLEESGLELHDNKAVVLSDSSLRNGCLALSRNPALLRVDGDTHISSICLDYGHHGTITPCGALAYLEQRA